MRLSDILPPDDPLRESLAPTRAREPARDPAGLPAPADRFLTGWEAAAPTLDRRVEVRLRRMDGHAVELASVEVAREARGQGLGSAALSRVTELADETGATVVLYPEPSLAARLGPYYERFGFVSMDGGQSMTYEPRDA